MQIHFDYKSNIHMLKSHRFQIPKKQFVNAFSFRRMTTSNSSPYADYEMFQVATVRKEAPLFTAKAVIEGKISPKPLNLIDFRGKYVVLLFYPLDFTFVCPTEILAYNKRLAEFECKNTQALCISVDSVYSHLAWSRLPLTEGGLGDNSNPVRIPMLSDITKEISKDYGVLIENEGISLRGQFIIDMNGILRHSSINDLPIGRNVEETLRTLQAIQFSDENKGHVMPCDWTPGHGSIKI